MDLRRIIPPLKPSPRQHLLEALRVGLDLHVRQMLKKELDKAERFLGDSL